MATSPSPTMSTTRGMSFVPSNGVAARMRSAEIDAQIAAARQKADEESRKFTRTRKSGKAWGSR